MTSISEAQIFSPPRYTLGIETSCDDTSVAVVSYGREVCANVIASQAAIHAQYGGVVPEVASRQHIEGMIPAFEEALRVANLKAEDLDAISVTNRPGLLGALLVGVSAAKALAYGLRIPLIGVHHLEGHIYSNFLVAPDLSESFPILVLIVSGGHTQIIRMEGHGRYLLLGQTRDDAAGEAFDKGARLMGLPYPGGPHISRLAQNGNPKAFAFPRSWLGESLDFSYSGVKTAVRMFLERNAGEMPLEDVAASYEAAIVDVLVEKMRRAAHREGITTLCVAGGVAANRKLQADMKAMADREGFRVVIPPPALCTDNAAMIAAAGYYRLQSHAPDNLALDTYATETLAQRAETAE